MPRRAVLCTICKNLCNTAFKGSYSKWMGVGKEKKARKESTNRPFYKRLVYRRGPEPGGIATMEAEAGGFQVQG